MSPDKKTMTDVLKKLDRSMPVNEGAVFNIGPKTASDWGVEPGYYIWRDGEAVREGDYRE